MSDLALTPNGSAEVAGGGAWRIPAPSKEVAKRLALFALFLGLGLPDCCLNGAHVMGSGMEAFGQICRARV